MPDNEEAQSYLGKAAESLAAAQVEFAAGRYNVCVNRCYFACFQAAIAALLQAGVEGFRSGDRIRHDAVQAQFASYLVDRRKLYASEFRTVLPRLISLRHIADYRSTSLSQSQARQALRSAEGFVSAVLSREEKLP